MKSKLPTANDIKELVDFLPILYAPEFKTTEKWTTENRDGTLCFPYPTYTKSVERFFRLAAKECWSDYKYNPVDAKNMLENEKNINHASLKEIKTMLTYCVRGERFCDGFWGSVIENGKIRALLERLREILQEYK